MAPIADLEGSPIGWGELDGVELLLLGVGREGSATLDASGVRRTIDTTGLDGLVVATWSPRRDAIWLQSGVQTSVLRLDTWSPDKRRELATLPNDIGATNITVSPNLGWVAIWGGGCFTGGAAAGCALSVAVAEAGAERAIPVVANLAGIPASAWVADDGTVLFTVAISGGGFDIWRALPDSPAELWYAGVTMSPLAGARLAVTSADTAVVIDLASATESPLELRVDVVSGDILSVSPDAGRVAYRSEGATLAVRKLEAASTVTELSLPSLTGVGVHWPGDDRFVAVSFGPPPTTVVMRLFE